MNMKITFMVLCFASFNYAIRNEAQWNGLRKQFRYVNRLNNFRYSPTIEERIVPFNRLLDRIGFYGRVLLAGNINNRTVKFLADVNLIQISRDVGNLDHFGQSTSIEGRIELFNRISDIIDLLELIILAGDRNNGTGSLVGDLTLDQLSHVEIPNNSRRSLTKAQRIELFNCLLDKIRFYGQILLAYDRNNRIINLVIHLRLNKLSRDMDNVENLGDTALLRGVSLAGDEYGKVLNKDSIRDPIFAPINIKIDKKDQI